MKMLLTITCLFLFLAPSLGAGEPIETAFVNSGITITGGSLAIASDLIDPILQDQLANSPQFNLLEVRSLDDPTMQDDPEVEVASLLGIDLDGDTSNNFSGNNLFEVTPESLDDLGNPLVIFTPGSITGGLLSAGPADLTLPGGIPVPNVLLELTIEPGGSSAISPSIPTAIPVLIIDAIPAPFPFDGFPFNYTTMTEVFAFLGIVPDTDIDGDGVFDAFSIEFSLEFISCQLSYPVIGGSSFIRGDFNGDSALDISDAVNLLGYMFTSGAAPGCMDSCDNDDNGDVNLGDAILLLGNLFTGGSPPAAPNDICGPDPTDDPLECLSPPQGC